MGTGVALGFDLEIVLGARLDRIERLLAQLARPRPQRKLIQRMKSTGAVTGTPTVLAFDNPGPSPGRIWDVRAVAVVGNDDRTNIANTNVALYVGEPNAVGVGDVFLPGTQGGTAVTVPANVQFGEDQCCVIEPDRLYVVVYGVATGTQVTAVMFAWDKPADDVVDWTAQGPADRHHDTEPAGAARSAKGTL